MHQGSELDIITQDALPGQAFLKVKVDHQYVPLLSAPVTSVSSDSSLVQISGPGTSNGFFVGQRVYITELAAGGPLAAINNTWQTIGAADPTTITLLDTKYGSSAWISGGNVKSNVMTTKGTGGISYLNLDFGKHGRRRIDILLSNGALFGGTNTAVQDSIEPVPMNGPLGIWIGDSFVEGTGAAGFGTEGMVQALADVMGWENFAPSGVGGTGMLQGNGISGTFRSRLAADVIAYNPDVVIVHGSVNDGMQTGVAIGAETTAIFTQLRRALPNSLLIGVGPFVTVGKAGIPSNVEDQRTAIRAAVQQVDGLFLDILQLPRAVGAPPFQTGNTLAAPYTAGVFRNDCPDDAPAGPGRHLRVRGWHRIRCDGL
jgi:lysophospholipase L1-like esterase